MPAATRYIGLPDQDQQAFRAIEDAYNAEITERQKQYKRAWAYYYGDHKKHLVADKSNTDDNLVINLIELLIDKGVSNLMGTSDTGVVKGPEFDIVGDAEPEDERPQPGMMQRMGQAVGRMMNRMRPGQHAEKSPEQDYLDRVWEANEKSIILHDLAVNGGVTGTFFIKLQPDGVPDPNNPASMLPRIIILNPSNVAAFWDESDMRRILWYRVQYGADGSRKRQDIVRDVADDGSDLNAWTIYDYAEKRQGGSPWSLVNKTQWEYPWAPIIAGKNLPKPNEFYGMNDIRKNGNLNDGLNFVASNMQRIIKYHAAPNTIATGVGAEGIQQTGVDRLWAIDDASARVYNLEMQSDLGSSLAFMQVLRRAFFDGGRELDSGTVQDKLGALTNFGLRVLYRDSLEKTGTKRLLYGAALRQICSAVLELGGFGAGRKVQDKWPDPLPHDELQTAQALTLDRQHGLSIDTYLERRGYSSEEEAEKRERERGEAIMDATIQRQGTMLDAVRSRGNGQRPNGQMNQMDDMTRRGMMNGGRNASG